MKPALKIVATLMFIIGGIWLLQGLNVLPGSFMTGQTKWAVYGAITMIGGVVLWLVSRRP